ncbi:MAG: hypothetical protein K2J77_12510 [Oscillospiraceae bacterium]|nr:hypothetical protein [Oscillospiraceae bacterium]
MNTFEIHEIHYGWFQVCFTPHAENQGWLTNSDYLGCEAPTNFLVALADILEEKSTEEWLCWQDEPGASILRLVLEDGKIAVEIFTAEKDSLDLPYNGAELALEEKTLDYKNTFEIKHLLDDILVEFSLYEKGNGLRLYEKHWGQFPKAEYHRLRECAAEINNTLDKYSKMFCFEY